MFQLQPGSVCLRLGGNVPLKCGLKGELGSKLSSLDDKLSVQMYVHLNAIEKKIVLKIEFLKNK